MLIFGKVCEIEGYKVKLKVEEFDSYETVWLFVPQKYTVNKKSKQMPEMHQLVAAILTDDMTDGIVLGGIYNDEDIPAEIQGDEFTVFGDGSSFSHTENAFNLSVDNLFVTGNVVVGGEIQDKKGTLDSVRNHSNTHVHGNGNNGSNTTEPIAKV